jgi:hypothetical protein
MRTHWGFLLLTLAATGCTRYSEDFTKYNPDGTIAHVVSVRHNTFLIVGKATNLKTETQTDDFLRNVNADGVSIKTDSDAAKALTEGIAKGVVEGLKASQGIP